MALTAQTLSDTIDRVSVYSDRHIMPTIKQNVFSHSPYAATMLGESFDRGRFGTGPMSGAGKRTQGGGSKIQIQHELGENSTATNMAGAWSTYSTTPQDFVRRSEQNYKHYVVSRSFSLTDQLMNTGEEQIADLVMNQSTNAFHSVVKVTTQDVISGTAATAATGSISLASANDSVQGLSGATYANWNSRGVSARGTAAGSVSFASGSFSAQGVADMRKAWNNASEGLVQPNAIFTTYAVFEFYEATVVTQERYTAPANTGDSGFVSLAYKRAPVYAEPLMTSGVMLFVNTDCMFTVFLRGADFEWQPFKDAANQESRNSSMAVKFNQVVDDRRLINKLTGISA